MIRIAGVNLPDDKRVEIALTYIYGIGRSTSQKILTKLNIDFNTRTKDITESDAQKIREEIDARYNVEGELRHQVKMNN